MKRNLSIDLLKSVGIVAVVAFHCNLMPEVMNLFHNPLFMFVAGIFHPHEASSTIEDYCRYLKKRFFRIYLPFILLTAFLTIVQPLLIKWHLLFDVPYTIYEMPKKLITIFAMRVEGFSGPCWFLISLLEISIVFELIRFFTHHLSPRLEMIILLVISLVIFPIGIYAELPRVLDESMTMFVWYVIGFYMRPYLETLRTWQLGLSPRYRCVWMIGLCAICIILFPCMLFLANIGC